MSDEVDVTIGAPQFEVPVVGCEPLVEDFGDLYPVFAEQNHARGLFASMSGVAFDGNREQTIRHLHTVTLKSEFAW